MRKIGNASAKEYAADMRRFRTWCATREARALPASPWTIAEYIEDLSRQGRRSSTIKRACASIARHHRDGQYGDPTKEPSVIAAIGGLRDAAGATSTRGAPISDAQFFEAVRKIGSGMKGDRDRAMLTVGRAAMLSASELAALDLDDIKFIGPSGCAIEVGGKRRMIDGDAFDCLTEWLARSGVFAGKVFRSVNRGGAVGRSLSAVGVRKVIKRYFKAAGLTGESYSASSIRNGAVVASMNEAAAVDALRRVFQQSGLRGERIMAIAQRLHAGTI